MAIAGQKIRSELKVPYYDGDLMSLSSFISYCEENGLNTSKEELEYFDQSGLFLPAALLSHGIAKFRKIYAKFDGGSELEWRFVYYDELDKFDPQEIEEQPYFDSVGISTGSKDSIKYYRSHGMLLDPSIHDYLSWDSFKPIGGSWSRTPEEVKRTTVCYSRWQFYPLRFVKSNRQIILANAALFKEPEDWIKSGENIRSHFESRYSDEFLRGVVQDYYKFFSFITDLLNMEDQSNEELLKYYWDSRRELSEYYENQIELEAGIKADLDTRTKEVDKKTVGEIKRLLEKYDFSPERIRDWRYRIVQRGWLSAHRFPRKYVEEIKDKVLEDTEDAYRDVALINRILVILGEKPETVKQVILNSRLPFCPFCGSPMEMKRKDQKTCGDPKCRKELENHWKKENYRSRKTVKE